MNQTIKKKVKNDIYTYFDGLYVFERRFDVQIMLLYVNVLLCITLVKCISHFEGPCSEKKRVCLC